jgi:hypothetical protein
MRRFLMAAALLTLAWSMPARAELALDFTGGGEGFPITEQTLGWQFSLSEARTVTALGMFDVASDGLSDDHAVGLWTLSGTLLGSVTVTSTSTPVASTSPDGRWLFESLALPLLLGPGDYVIGADYPSETFDNDTVITGTDAPATATGLTFVGGRFTSAPGPGLDFPDLSFTTSGGHFGPNLLFGPAAIVPEPSTFILAGLGGLSLAGLARHRRRKS